MCEYLYVGWGRSLKSFGFFKGFGAADGKEAGAFVFNFELAEEFRLRGSAIEFGIFVLVVLIAGG